MIDYDLQNDSSSITEWSDDHPFLFKGNTVGLFKTGKILLISDILSFGAFNNIYFDLRFKELFPLIEDRIAEFLNNEKKFQIFW